jgi:hypothetical protein
MRSSHGSAALPRWASQRPCGRSIPEPPSASVSFRPAFGFWKLDANTYKNQSGASGYDRFGRDDDERLLPRRPDPPSDYPEELIEEAEARARMSTLQRDELLTQSKILEKETSPSAKEANQHSEAEPCETKHVQTYNRTVVRWQQAILLISRSAGVLASHNR